MDSTDVEGAVHAVTRIPIAIVGMAGCYAGAGNVGQFWHNIVNKVDAIRDADPDWVGPYYDPDSTANDRTYTIKGGFISDVAEVDPFEFGVLPSTAEGGEPDHLLALRYARDALADAGYLDREFNRERAGIVLGRGTYANRGNSNLLSHGLIIDQTLALMRPLRPDFTEDDWSSLRAELKKQLPPYSAELVAPLTPNVITGRIANRLNLMGPNFLVDAACASSLIALDMAVSELQTGRCDLMLSGGVQAQVPPQLYIQFCLLNALSRDKIRPFGRNAGGTLLGEGCGVLVLKRLADAERDGDNIYAVVRGIGTSSDGRAKGLLAPRLEGEVLAVQRAYESSGIDPASVQLIEAHGTGTAIGDKTELQALQRIFAGSADPIALGSVKSMIGHCLPAAGSAALIKTALALHHKVLPPTLCDEPDPELGFDRGAIYVNTETRPWIHGKDTPRRAGVNAFGFGGINAHIILEEYRGPESQPATRRPAAHRVIPQSTELITLAAADAPTLTTLAEQTLLHLRGPQPPTLAEVARASAAHHSGAHRLAIVASSENDLAKKLEQAIEKLRRDDPRPFKTRSGVFYGAGAAPGKLAFLYPGEGSQYVGMLADVCMSFPQCADWFDFIEAAGERRGALSRATLLFPRAQAASDDERRAMEDRIFDMDIAAESVFAASLGLQALLDDLGFAPDAMLGHSTGENTALTTARVRRYQSREELSQTVCELQALYRELDDAGQIAKGTLLTIGALRPEVRSDLLTNPGRMQLAMDNCPNQVVMFGSEADAAALQERLSAEGAVCMALPFGRAYHTPLFKPMADAYRRYFAGLDFGPGRATLYSARSCAPFPDDAEGICELAGQQWENPVRFTEAIQAMYDDGYRVFVEVGPSGNLTSFVSDILRDRSDVVAVSCNSRRKPGVTQLHQTLAQLFTAGISFDPGALYTHRSIADFELQSEPRPARRPVPKLKLQMPSLSFPRDWQPHSGLQLPSAPADAASVPVPSAKVVPIRRNSSSDIQVPSGPAAAGTSAEARAAAVQAHFQLMQEFLDSQMRVMSRAATVTSGQNIPSIPVQAPDLVPRFAPPATKSSPSMTPPPAVVPTFAARSGHAAPYPMLGRIVEQSTEQLIAERRFTTDQDPVFQDHAIGSAPSARNPDLKALAVIPFTFSMEIVAEAAMALAGSGLRLRGIREARGHRWLTLDDGSVSLRIVADRVPPAGDATATVRVRIYLPNATIAGGLLVFEGMADLAVAYAVAPAPLAWTSDDARAPVINTDDRLYSQGMFHGPRLQCVRSIRRWALDAIEGELEVLPRDLDFTQHPGAHLVTNAALIDAIGQLAAYWLTEMHGWTHYCFPYRIRSFQAYADPLPTGARVLCRGQIMEARDMTIEARFDLIGPDGRLLLRFEGWEDRHFVVPERFHAFRLRPQTEFLSTAQPASSGVWMRHMESFPEHLLETGYQIWKRVLAHMLLGVQERELFARLPARGARREEWLMGRVAAKDAVRVWAREVHGIDLAPADIDITNDEHGRPHVSCPALPMAAPVVSISHSQGHAIAAVAAASVALGVDLQSLHRVDADALSAGAFSTEESTMLDKVPPADRTRAATAMWCAKEAAAKALGKGLGGRPLDFRIVEAQIDRRTAPSTPTFIKVRHDDRTLHVDIDFRHDDVIAVCIDANVSSTRDANPHAATLH